MKNKKSKLLDIIIENDKDKLEEFIMINGKRKPYCPIAFFKEEDIDKIDYKIDIL